jgi:hypothetical protein
VGLQRSVRNDAELVPVGIPKDDEVGVIGVGPVVHARSAEGDETLDVVLLVIGVEVEMEAHRLLRWVMSQLQRDRQSGATGIDQHHELRVPFLFTLAVAQCGRPERHRPLHVLDVDDHGREMQVACFVGLVNHAWTSASGDEGRCRSLAVCEGQRHPRRVNRCMGVDRGGYVSLPRQEGAG